MIKSFYRLPTKDIKDAVMKLEKEGKIKSIEISGKGGLIRCDDIPIIEEHEEYTPIQSTFVLHWNDYLVKSNEYWLKERFYSQEHEILQYILIDGHFSGTVLGKFRNGPFDIEDICLTLPEEEKIKRKDEIILPCMM